MSENQASRERMQDSPAFPTGRLCPHELRIAGSISARLTKTSRNMGLDRLSLKPYHVGPRRPSDVPIV